MKKYSRLGIAALFVAVMLVIATSVWAAPVFRGTVPQPPTGGTGGGGGGGEVNMGTATFVPNCTGCEITVTKVSDPASLAPAPEGKAFLGDAFELKNTGTGSVKIVFSLPKEYADKGAKIFFFNGTNWVEVSGAVAADGTISVEVSQSGVYTLIGNS